MELTDVVKLRRAVYRSIAEYTWNDCLPEHVHDILGMVKEDGPRLRCCVHKERAVLRNRIHMALGQPTTGIKLTDAAVLALSQPVSPTLPIIDVLPDACDQCPIEKYYVTDVCRHCISHKCMNNCPKKAISIYGGRAFINRDLCIECGRCKQSCPYGAIIEISRPCIRACALHAISYDTNKRSKIDYSKCVQCGNCRLACPFGALDERSMIVQLLSAIKRGEKVVAMLAPSFIGQFGMKIKPEQIIAALHKIGFTEVMEVAVGADLTAINETKELEEKVPAKQKFMTSSCCPAFVHLVKKHFPDNVDKISETVSPMVACARYIKNTMGSPLTCFIGPCIAKKSEARENPNDINFVLTYEELQCMFEGIGIDLTQPVGDEYKTMATTSGIGFPLHKGVQTAVVNILAQEQKSVKAEYAAGLNNCQEMMEKLIDGESDAQYFEGMACANGCVDGPGSLSDQGLTRVLVTRFAKAAPIKVSADNTKVQDAAKTLNLEVK